MGGRGAIHEDRCYEYARVCPRASMSLKRKFTRLLLVASALCAVAVSYQSYAISARVSTHEIGLIRELLLASTALTIALVVVISVVALGVVTKTLLEPIQKITEKAKALSARDYSHPLGWKRRDEVGLLALEIDALCDQLRADRHISEERIEALDQLRHSDRVATLGRLASSVAHELGNPLNVIEMRAQLIVAGDVTTLDDARASATIIATQARSMTRIISEILSFARRQPPRRSEVDLVSVARNAIALSEHTAKKRALSIELDAAEGAIQVYGDAGKLLQIVVNLVLNGIQATQAGGVVEVGVRNAMLAPRHDLDGVDEPYGCIEVIDHGGGIPEELLSKIFEPFVSSKPADEGTGLGLTIAKGIATEHDGWIDVHSEFGRGSRFTVYLPRDGRRDGDHGWQTAFHR